MAKFSLPVASGTPSPANSDSPPKTRAEGGTVMTEISRELGENPLVLYMKGSPAAPQCGFSARAVQILGQFGVPLHTVDILSDPEKRQAIKEFSDWPTIPQVYIRGEFIGGSDILSQIFENGELAEMLSESA
jgi:monothiol glutaredoxin